MPKVSIMPSTLKYIVAWTSNLKQKIALVNPDASSSAAGFIIFFKYTISHTGDYIITWKHTYLGVILVISSVYQYVKFYLLTIKHPKKDHCKEHLHEGMSHLIDKP